MTRVKRRLLWLAAIALLLGLWAWSRVMCIRAYLAYGMVAEQCPEGDPQPRAFINGYSLRRSVEGTVTVGAVAHYTTGPSDENLVAGLGRTTPTLFLVDGKTETPLVPVKGWKSQGTAWDGTIVLPAQLKDGDYLLRVKLDTPLGEATTDAALPVFAPAKVHLITDRPLYEPGNTIHFRALVLRSRDLVPLEGRPGRFVVTSPSGEVMLEERAAAGDMGIIAGSFPLDNQAETGAWRIAWQSGAASGEASVSVEPFTLPRFRIESETNKPFYQRGDRPEITGRVVYSSGAPVVGAILEIRWSASGAWPPPTDWMTDVLPKSARSDAQGRFVLKLPPIPQDLIGQATLSAQIAATDPTGDRVEGGASLLLSRDAIRIDVVTELEGGLVEGFNNRVFLRATSAAGTVMPKTQLTVRRAWEPSDPGVKVETDEDGVASLQLDPGPAVNVVIPGMPIRPPPRPPAVYRTNLGERITGEELSLEEQLAIDQWNAPIASCLDLTESETVEVQLYVRVSAAGQVTGTSVDRRPLSRCVAKVIEGRRLPAGGERLLDVSYQLSADIPRFLLNTVDGAPSVAPGVEEGLREALLFANACLPRRSAGDDLPYVLFWQQDKKDQPISGALFKDPNRSEVSFPAGIASCLGSKLARFSAVKHEGEDGEEDEGRARFGWARFAIQPASEFTSGTDPDTVQLGYELEVKAKAGTEALGDTKVFVSPGSVPDLRLRTTPTLAKAGDVVELVVLRGPNFSGELPEKVWLSGESQSIESVLDPKTRTAKFELSQGASGWYQVYVNSARAMVYVRPALDLTVEVKSERPVYKPGEMAKLLLRTTAKGAGHPAAVGLFGVDDSLSQLVSLPGPTELSHLQPLPPSLGAAFGVLDVEALALGRIRGENALAATILRVNGLPSLEELDTWVQANQQAPFDPLEALTDRFYFALGELYAEVRTWEQSAPKDQQMMPSLQAKLWKNAIARAEKKGTPATDAYNRPLRLSQLPPDLLALTDPRMVVIDGTRLPEDVENWAAWVQKEQP